MFSFLIIAVVYVIDYTSDSLDFWMKEVEQQKKTERVIDRYYVKKWEEMNTKVNLQIEKLSEWPSFS